MSEQNIEVVWKGSISEQNIEVVWKGSTRSGFA
jgi:hypothetical protein